MKGFSLKILKAEGVFYEGQCDSLVVPTDMGQLGILAGRSDMVAPIVTGELSYKAHESDEWKYASVSDGMVKVENGEVLILTESAEYSDMIDVRIAEQAIIEAKDVMQQKRSLVEYNEAAMRISRANNRIRVHERHSL